MSENVTISLSFEKLRSALDTVTGSVQNRIHAVPENTRCLELGLSVDKLGGPLTLSSLPVYWSHVR